MTFLHTPDERRRGGENMNRETFLEWPFPENAVVFLFRTGTFFVFNF